MLRRSRRLLTGSLLRLVVGLLVVLHRVTATTASATAPTRRMRGGGSSVSSPLASLHHRGLSLVSGRARDEETQQEASEDENKKVEAVVASPYGTGRSGGDTGRALASEGASMTTAAAATKAKPTGNSATSAAASDTEATAGNTTASSNSTHNSPSPASSANSTGTDALDDASGAIDDDTEGGASSPAHYSQWDVTNATDFDGMLRNQTYRGPGLLPPDDADPPPHWDVAMASLFAGLAVLLCVGTAFRRYRNQQRQRVNYEPIHSITV
jgi:hypothetical protein